MSPETTPVSGRRTPPRDRVAAVLRRRIRSGELEPGTRLPTQQDLETEFGVKRSVVRRALATLQDEGLVTMGRGAPATVSEPAAPPSSPGGPRPAGVLLADRVRAALAAEHVTIDVFSMTTETLNTALAGAMPDITNGTLTPQSLSLRVLLPSPEARLAFPRVVSGPEDGDPALERAHDKMRLFAGALQGQVQALQDLDLVPEVSVDIRSVPITPVHKLYLLNGTESLMGYYQLVEHSVEIDKEEMDIYDSFGFRTKLFRSSNGPDRRDEQDAAFVDESLLWFESLWSTIAQPFTLG